MDFPTALQACDMLLIDTLHAFDFSIDEQDTLHIECMDGRELKRWQFTLAEQNAATPTDQPHTFSISHDGVAHQLTCLSAFSAGEDETDPE